MVERIERREEVRARNLGVRVTRNNVTEPTPGTIAHRVWDSIYRLRKPNGSVDRHNVLNTAARERDQPGHGNGTVKPMEQVSWHEEGGAGMNWAGPPPDVAAAFSRPLFRASGCWDYTMRYAPPKKISIARPVAWREVSERA